MPQNVKNNKRKKDSSVLWLFPLRTGGKREKGTRKGHSFNRESYRPGGARGGGRLRTSRAARSPGVKEGGVIGRSLSRTEEVSPQPGAIRSHDVPRLPRICCDSQTILRWVG